MFTRNTQSFCVPAEGFFSIELRLRITPNRTLHACKIHKHSLKMGHFRKVCKRQVGLVLNEKSSFKRHLKTSTHYVKLLWI